MAITPPVPIPPAPALPQRNDPATFEARADAYYAWQSEALPDGIDAQSSATYTNAQEAAQSAQAAEDEKDLAILARQGAENARDAAQAAQGGAEDARDSAWVAAAAAQAGSLPQPLIPGRVLAATGPDTVGWIEPEGVAQGHQVITTSQNWPRPADATWVYIEAIGAGASGCAARGGLNRAPGGGGGAFNCGLFRAADLPSVVALEIGAGGAQTARTGVDGDGVTVGNKGGDTIVGPSGAPLLVAPGGEGFDPADDFGGGLGGGGLDGAGFSAGAGGSSLDPGAASAGRNSIKGGAGGGGAGTTVGDSPGGISLEAGNGGIGRSVASTNVTGGVGLAPGGGGGGGRSGTGTGRGGAGARGEIKIWWW